VFKAVMPMVAANDAILPFSLRQALEWEVLQIRI
jgi:hypothetical protein